MMAAGDCKSIYTRILYLTLPQIIPFSNLLNISFHFP